MNCVCQKEDNDFVIINDTKEYSGIEFALNRQGMLRIRYYNDDDTYITQDIINIKYCPYCGKQF